MTIKNQVLTLIIPKEDEVGSFIHFLLNDEIYLVGNKTNNKLNERLKKLPDGKYSVQLSGIITQEKGNFPNPMETFDVIEVLDLVIL